MYLLLSHGLKLNQKILRIPPNLVHKSALKSILGSLVYLLIFLHHHISFHHSSDVLVLPPSKPYFDN